MPRYVRDGDVWQIVQVDSRLEISSGGKTSVRKFVSADHARAQQQRLIEQQAAAGYRPLASDVRHPELEAAIAADPEQPMNYSVYADWLQREGDPRGTLIALQVALDEGTGDLAALAAAARRELKLHAADLLGPLAAFADGDDADEVFGWRFGFIHRASLSAGRPTPLDAMLGQLLDHASGRFVVELSLTGTRRAQAAIDVLAEQAPASLRALRLSKVEDLELGALWPATRHLRRLSLVGRALRLGTLALPGLERLHLADRELTSSTARMLARARWPVLRQLHVDLGHAAITGDASIDELLELLRRSDLHALDQLALINIRQIAELVHDLPACSIAAQLKRLDLSANLMTDAHAFQLAKHRDRFPSLVHLDVSLNRLTAAGLKALRGLTENVRSTRQM